MLPNSECGIHTKDGKSFIEGLPIENTTTHGRWFGGWLHQVQDYSTRSLTVEQDKLPALSGVARMLANQTGDSYYAGLWERHIHEDLCWRVYPHEEIRVFVPDGFDHVYGQTLCIITRASKYQAPSWSWATLDGRILFQPIDLDHIVADFIACHITPSGQDSFGRVSGGWIKLWVRPLLPL